MNADFDKPCPQCGAPALHIKRPIWTEPDEIRAKVTCEAGHRYTASYSVRPKGAWQ